MSDFELVNKDVEEWERAQFWESDPMQNNQELCEIVLWINWENKTATVETIMKDNSIPGELYHGLASAPTIPTDTDFTRFAKYYDEKIKTILQTIGEGFEAEWNGSNWIGTFNHDEALNEKLDQLLCDSPTHDMIAYFSLIDSYGGSKNRIISDLGAEGIDLKTATLDDDGIMSLAVEIVTYGDGSDYKLIDVDVEDELKDIQKELQEEEEE